MWNQIYNPLGNAALSTVAAAIPVVTLLVLIASGKVKAHIAAIIAVILSNLIAILIFTMPAGMSIRATLLGIVAGFFPIGWIVLNVIFLYQITVVTGKFELLKRAKVQVESDKPLREMEMTPEDKKRIKGFMFLSEKPIFYVLNIGESTELGKELDEAVSKYNLTEIAGRPNAAATAICGKVEAELAEMSDADAAEFLSSYGLTESGLVRLIRTTYKLLGLISFFTAGEDECRAWQVPANSRAQQAAGAIHSDLEKHFIRAETIRWDQLLEAGSEANARTKGTLRLEGKDYIVQDGDVMHIRHSG